MDTSNTHRAAADARSDQPTDELHEALAPPDLAFVRKYIEPLCRPLELYHRYSLVHAERLPKTGPVLLVCTHSFASYDLVLLVLSVMQQTGRLARALGHKQLWFFHPIMSALSQRIGVVPGTPDAGHKLLAAGELVAVAPGGTREAIRHSGQRFSVSWQNRNGFARLALQTGATVVLAATPAADQIFTLYDNPLTRRIYERFKLAPPLLRGIGPTVIPRPVKLTSYLSQPIVPPPFSGSEAEVHAFRDACESQMNALITEAVAAEGLR